MLCISLESSGSFLKRRIFSVILVLIMVLSIMPVQAYGLTYTQNTKAQPKVVWDYLYKEIGNAYAVAGIMGNLAAESGLIPNNLANRKNKSLGLSDKAYTNQVDDGTYTNFAGDGGGYGIAQWTSSARKKNLLKFAKAMDGSVGNVEVQLGFLMKELRGTYKSVLNALKKATSVREASDVFLLKFERAANTGESARAKRAAKGQVYYDRYAPKEQSTGTADSSASSGSSSSGSGNTTSGSSESGSSSGTLGTQPENTKPVSEQNGSGQTENTQTGSTEKTDTQTTVKLSSDAALKSLSVSGQKLSPSFKPAKTSYSLKVDSDVTSIAVKAVQNDSAASVKITGAKKLAVGKNTVKITVTAADGTKKVYKITVDRSEPVAEEPEEITNIDSLLDISELMIAAVSDIDYFMIGDTKYTQEDVRALLMAALSDSLTKDLDKNLMIQSVDEPGAIVSLPLFITASAVRILTEMNQAFTAEPLP